MFATYRSKLLAFSVVLVLFIGAILLYSYFYTRSVIVEQAQANLGQTGQLLDTQMRYERNELLRYSGIVSDDLRIQEYMFTVYRIGTDADPLRKLYEKLYGWLPIDRTVIVGVNGEILVGEQEHELVEWVRAHNQQPLEQVFYISTGDGVELMAVAPISYRGDRLGMVVITQRLDRRWMQQKKLSSGGEVFLVRGRHIVSSSLDAPGDLKFVVQGEHVTVDGKVYRAYPIRLPSIDNDLPQLWFGASENTLIEAMNRFTQVSLMVLGISGLVMLWMAYMIFRNFNHPLTQITSMIDEITEGRIPTMVKSEAQNEIDRLANKFADMLQSLREKQAEIDMVHRQLEESAITDSLTGLYNRRHLQEIFPKLLAQARRDWRVLSMVICDLDYFKAINDKYGHLAGDQCIVQFARLLKQQSRSNDFLYRVGGEEFLILSINTEPADAIAMAEKVRGATSQAPVMYKGTAIDVTVSCGVSFSSAEDPEEAALPRLLSRADEALYQAKQHGRNQVRVYGQEDEKDEGEVSAS